MASWWQRIVQTLRGTSSAQELRATPHALDELERLSEELRVAERQLSERLEACTTAVAQGGGDRRATHALEEERTRLRQTIQRVAIAGRTTSELEAEWDDWLQYRGRLDPVAERRRRERMECLRSELAVRGIVVQDERTYATPSDSTSHPTFTSTPEPLEEDVIEKVHAVVRDDLMEVRDTLLPLLEAEIQRSCPATGCTEADAARWIAAQAKHQRTMHGLHRVLKRAH